MCGADCFKGTALLVLDVQNYFFDASSPVYLRQSARVLPRINELAIHATREQWLVVSTTHHAPSEPGNLMAHKWRHHPQPSESLLFPDLRLGVTARHICKEYYSAFFKTDLEWMLRSQAVDRVVICGVMTHLCVDTTTRHAFMLGFKPIVVADACCSKSDAYHSAALSALEHGFAHICSTRDIIAGGGLPCSTW